MALYNLIWRRRRHDIIDAVPLLAGKVPVNILLFQFYCLYKIFRPGFDWIECKYKFFIITQQSSCYEQHTVAKHMKF